MNITIVGRHIATGDNFRSYVESKVKDVADKYSIDPVELDIVVSKPGFEFRCDIYAHVAKGCYIRCHGEAKDAYQAIDTSANNFEKRLRKYKERLHYSHKAPDIKFSKEGINSYVIPADETEEMSDAYSPVIAEMDREVPATSLVEATLLMDLSDEDVFIFRSSTKNTVNILHRRKDGNIGWIEVKN